MNSQIFLVLVCIFVLVGCQLNTWRDEIPPDDEAEERAARSFTYDRFKRQEGKIAVQEPGVLEELMQIGKAAKHKLNEYTKEKIRWIKNTELHKLLANKLDAALKLEPVKTARNSLSSAYNRFLSWARKTVNEKQNQAVGNGEK